MPRTDLICIERYKTVRQALTLALRSGFSRIPVTGENEDDIVGIVYLKDLARRRKSGRQQLEQLRAARERLLEAHEAVRRTLEDATNELLVSLPEARVAAVDAGRKAEGEAEATVEELEAEIEAAREAGLPLVAPGDDVAKGQHLADIVDLFGDVVEEVHCPVEAAWVGSIRRPHMPIYNGDQVFELVGTKGYDPA